MKLLILDKDGTLVRPKSGHKFVQKPWDQIPLEGAQEKVREYAKDGWYIAVASNQGGIAAGHKTVEATVMEFEFLFELFPEISDAYFCPDFEGEQCYRLYAHKIDSAVYVSYVVYSPEQFDIHNPICAGFRKPGAGMLLLAMGCFPCDEEDQYLYVGDREEDEQAAHAAKIPFMWAHDWLKPEQKEGPEEVDPPERDLEWMLKNLPIL